MSSARKRLLGGEGLERFDSIGEAISSISDPSLSREERKVKSKKALEEIDAFIELLNDGIDEIDELIG